MCQLKENGNWSEPKMLHIKNYDRFDRGRQSGATMATMENTVAVHDTGKRRSTENDIFVCFLSPDGTWTEPKSLGKKINFPEYDEMTPYLAADGDYTLFQQQPARWPG